MLNDNIFQKIHNKFSLGKYETPTLLKYKGKIATKFQATKTATLIEKKFSKSFIS